MVKPFEKAVFAMMPGDVSDIVETEFGFHLIKLEEKKPARTVEFAEAKEQISSFLAQEKMNEKVEAFLAEVRARADIKIPSQQARKE
jgi:peptidyl-prolyl cis-trans isomerase C